MSGLGVQRITPGPCPQEFVFHTERDTETHSYPLNQKDLLPRGVSVGMPVPDSTQLCQGVVNSGATPRPQAPHFPGTQVTQSGWESPLSLQHPLLLPPYSSPLESPSRGGHPLLGTRGGPGRESLSSEKFGGFQPMEEKTGAPRTVSTSSWPCRRSVAASG